MSVYLHDIPLSDAIAELNQALRKADLWRVLSKEIIPLDENAVKRVLAEPVWALKSSPHYHASAMDGFAVRAEMTVGALPAAPISLSLGEQAKYVDTGEPLPDWANAIIPIENVESVDALGNISSDVRNPDFIRIRSSIVPWSHVRPLGEDIVATQLVLPAGHTLGPYDLGAIAASGHVSITVAKRPRIGIIPTGSELVPIGSELRPGDILEYNSLVIAGQIKAMGAEPVRFPITFDDFDLISDRVVLAAQSCDLVILNAGSSAGSEDFSSRVVEKLGTLLVHGVAVRPGHPVILGMVNRQAESFDTVKEIPIIGVPGYPVSAALTVDIFIEPLIACWLGRRPLELPVLPAFMTRKTVSPPGDDDYIRVVVGMVGDKMLAAPISRGAGVITSLVRADGLVVLPRGVQGVDAGEPVSVRLLRSREEIGQTIFCIGSHDVILDLMAQFLAQNDRRFVSANVGSQGGLVALRRGEAHLSGSHLLDPDSGDYNLRYIREYLPEIRVRVMGFVHREQGLIVRKGNPKAIKGLIELAAGDVAFINRQRGAGTRVLLDFHLNLLGIDSDRIKGYDDEEYTHLGVAAAVASGRADCGMGIPAAAQALELGFIPLYKERYDLIIPNVIAETELMGPLLKLLESQDFKNAINKLPGYDTTIMGKLIAEV
ncbi:MAG: molybdopterin biosynthesis protein [Chloroflexi bacterium]|nr:molybdopterin biosynthesis protein [Chloroflexota bacterium]